jgi:hypothetical protein
MRFVQADRAYGLLLIHGIVQFDRHENVRRRQYTSGDFIRSGSSGPWNWGEVDITGEGKWVAEDVGFGEPTETWGPFGWNELPRPFTGMYSGTRPPDGIIRSFFFPVWLLFSALALLPALKLLGLVVRVRRKARFNCIECGYNLTGNTSGVCPECGTAAN